MLNVSVMDSGVGIAQEDMPILFCKFGKLQRTAEINSAGIGLGLTIVKQIVEKGGGKVNVSSEGVGKGSLFSFSIKMLADKVEPSNIVSDSIISSSK